MLGVVVIACLTASRPATDPVQDCRGFEFKTELTKAPGQSNSKLVITVTGGKRPYHFLVLDEKNNPLSKEFSTSAFDNLRPGRYRCIVSDANDCTKEQSIEVK
jgi:hypothetical protein